MPKDLEDHVAEIHYVKGYPSLAAFIASDCDKSTAIYRRFDRLSARNLLYLQSELVELEARQDALDAEDLRGTLEDKDSARNWQTLKRRAAEPGNTREKERLEVLEEIRKKTKEYRESLVLESVLLTLKKPQTRTLEAFRNVFHNLDEAGHGYPTLGGRSAGMLNDTNDLVALRTRDDEDRLTNFLRYWFPLLFVTRRTDSRLAYLSERRLRVVVAVLNVILAAVLLFGAILNLYYVIDEQKRLGLIAGYTIVFAICVGLVTKARRSEVFAACAAYAAVLVVFVSGNLGGPGARSSCSGNTTSNASDVGI